jgi:hypothetical protein
MAFCDYLLWMTVNLAAPLPDTSCVYDAGCMIFMLYANQLNLCNMFLHCKMLSLE